MTFESDALLKFWLDFKNIEFSYTIVKYFPHFKSTFLYDWLGDKEDMSLQSTFFLCQLTPSYSNNTGYYEARSLEKEEKTYHFPFCFLFLFSLSLPVSIHFGTCLFLLFPFFFFPLHSSSNSLFQFSVCQQLQNQPCGWSRDDSISQLEPLLWNLGPWSQGVPFPTFTHQKFSHFSLVVASHFFSMCMIFLCFIFAFLIILHLVNDSYFYLFIFNLVLPHLWNLNSSTRDRAHGPSISAES